MTDTPNYSICMCNYNMADTLERSLTSLCTQLDEDFEVVLVDDGSTDDSIAVVKNLQKKFKILRLVELQKDPKRKLGLTRNISIEEAKGNYVILHLDCDDVFAPFIIDFTKVFHKLETNIHADILVSGQHINMARRDFLLEHGPYLNIYRGEDRNLWSRMAKLNAWYPLDHIDFITRLPKLTKRKILKNILDTYDHMKNDFRSGVSLWKYIYYQIEERKIYSLKLLIFRLAMLLPTWFMALFEEPITQEGTIGGPEEFAEYRDRIRGTYQQIMIRHGCDSSLSFLESDDAVEIFRNTGDSKSDRTFNP